MLGIDYSQLSEFERQILEIARTKYPKETKNFMQRVGNAMKKEIKSNLTSGDTKVKKKTGNLFRGLSRRKAEMRFIQGEKVYQVRVVNKAPHAWLVEHGHVLWFHHEQFWDAVKTDKRVPGHSAVGKSLFTYKAKYEDTVQAFIDEFLEKGFS